MLLLLLSCVLCQVVAKAADPHQLMLQRLTHELSQRKALVAKSEELKKAKAAAKSEAERARKKLDELQGQLVTLQDAAKPLQV